MSGNDKESTYVNTVALSVVGYNHFSKEGKRKTRKVEKVKYKANHLI